MLHNARMAGLAKLRCGTGTDCGGRLRAVNVGRHVFQFADVLRRRDCLSLSPLLTGIQHADSRKQRDAFDWRQSLPVARSVNGQQSDYGTMPLRRCEISHIGQVRELFPVPLFPLPQRQRFGPFGKPILSTAQITWVSGEENIKTFRLPSSRHMKSFCAPCGSALPVSQPDIGLLVVPAGSIDSPIDIRPNAHICCSSRANWDNDLTSIERIDGLPG